MTTFHDIESARDQWIDGPLDDDVLEELLAVSQQQVIAYAPKLPEGTVDVPVHYRYFQLQQAKNIWNASTVKSTGEFGEGDFIARPHPLDWVIKQGLRPHRAVPRVR